MDFQIGDRVYFNDSNQQQVNGTVIGFTGVNDIFLEVGRDDGLKGTGPLGGYTVARVSAHKIDAAETSHGFTVGDRVLCHFSGMGHKPCTVTGFKGGMVVVTCDDGYANSTGIEWLTRPDNIKLIESVAQPEAAVVLGWVPDELDREKYDAYFKNM